jgi:hypothetical protein
MTLDLRRAPAFIRRHLEAQVNMPSIRVQGFFEVDLIDAKSGVIKRHLEFKNLITNAALDAMYNTSVNAMISWAAVGTSSTAPTNGDTTLGAEIAPAVSNRTNNNGSVAITDTYTAGPPDYWEHVQNYLFVEAQANGNLTEIGLFTGSSGGTMWTRQLLKDGTGTPTVITKTATDQLRIIYKVRIYPPTADNTGTVTISTVNYDYITRAAFAASANWGFGMIAGGPSYGRTQTSFAYSGALGARTAGPAGSNVGNTSVSSLAYVSGNYYYDMTNIWDPSIANFGAGGIPSVGIMDSSSFGRAFQTGFTPFLPKDNTKRLTLVHRISWGRYP